MSASGNDCEGAFVWVWVGWEITSAGAGASSVISTGGCTNSSLAEGVSVGETFSAFFSRLGLLFLIAISSTAHNPAKGFSFRPGVNQITTQRFTVISQPKVNATAMPGLQEWHF